MAQPTPYNRIASFTTIQQQFPTDPLPGDELDAELNAVKTTLDQVLQNIALIQRDDGAVANKSIGFDQLKDEVMVGFAVPTAWATGVSYTLSSTVFYGGSFYRCLVLHASGVFATDLAAGKWALIANFTAEISSVLNGTSSSALTIGTGSKTFITQTDVAAYIGAAVLLASTADPTKYMSGIVTASSNGTVTFSVTHAVGAGTISDWKVNISGVPGVQGIQGIQGIQGNPTGIVLDFDTSTVDSDPGDGKFRANNATISSATQLFIDLVDVNFQDVSAFVDFFDDSTNAATKGVLYIVASDWSAFGAFSVNGVVVAVSGYRKVPIAPILVVGSFTGKRFGLSFTPASNPGADLNAIEALAGTGLAARTAADTWALRSLANAAAGITWTNPDGVSGNPTPVLANDLAALEGLAGTGIAVRTGADAWAQRSVAGTADEITATNGDGVAGNPTLSLPSALTFTGKTITGGVYAGTHEISQALKISGILSPPQITADQNDYNPSGASTAVVMRLTTDATRNITGFAGGLAGQIRIAHNVGSFNLVLVNEGAGSISTNRLALPADVTLLPNQSAIIQYDNNTARWRRLGGAGGTFANPTVTGGITPTTDDGAALGSTSLKFSDLFLAAGGVINWANGGVTITEVSDALLFAGAAGGYKFDALLVPTANDGAQLGTGSLSFSDLFLASGAVVNYNNGDLTGTHANASGFTWQWNAAAGRTFTIKNADTGGLSNVGVQLSHGAGSDSRFTISSTGVIWGNVSNHALRIDTNNTEHLTIGAAGNIYLVGAGTTASAANAFINSGSSPVNEILRSTSSLRYKRDVEDMTLTAAGRVVDQARPIFYRSAIPTDRQDWSHYGFAAEELALIDPRLVQFGYPPEAWELVETPGTDGAKHQELKPDAAMVPDGVAYDRMVVPLLLCVKQLRERVAALEAQQAAKP